MSKPDGFSIENLYENLEHEKKKRWKPKIPIDVLKAIHKSRKELTLAEIQAALRKSGLDYTIQTIRYQLDRAKEENLLDSE